MDALGFRDTFSLQEFVVTGSQVRIFRAYPYDWQIFALSDRDDEPAVKLGECPERPDYNVIAKVLEANSIVPKRAAARGLLGGRRGGELTRRVQTLAHRSRPPSSRRGTRSASATRPART